MTLFSSDAIRHRLEEVALQTPGDDQPLTETISAVAQQLAQDTVGPSALLEALLKMDRADLTIVAAELHNHAVAVARLERHSHLMGTISPVCGIDARTIFCAPVGEMDAEGFAEFSGRVLFAVLNTRPKVVLIHTGGLTKNSAGEEGLASLIGDLKEQGIKTTLL